MGTPTLKISSNHNYFPQNPTSNSIQHTNVRIKFPRYEPWENPLNPQLKTLNPTHFGLEYNKELINWLLIKN